MTLQLEINEAIKVELLYLHKTLTLLLHTKPYHT